MRHGSRFWVHLGRLGLGTEAFGKEVLYPISATAVSPIISDFDEDGLPDVAVVDYYGAMGVLSGKGDGSFYAIARYPILNCPNSVTSGDTNGDGILDFKSSNVDSSFDVYFGPIQGLQNPNVSYKIQSSQVILGDLGADGEADLITYSAYSSPISVLFGAGGGQFGTHVDLLASSLVSVTIADVDNDGWQDIVSLDYYANIVSVNRNLGRRTFAQSEMLLKLDNLYDFAIGDLNVDPLPDLVLSSGSGLHVALATAPVLYGKCR